MLKFWLFSALGLAVLIYRLLVPCGPTATSSSPSHVFSSFFDPGSLFGALLSNLTVAPEPKSCLYFRCRGLCRDFYSTRWVPLKEKALNCPWPQHHEFDASCVGCACFRRSVIISQFFTSPSATNREQLDDSAIRLRPAFCETPETITDKSTSRNTCVATWTGRFGLRPNLCSHPPNVHHRLTHEKDPLERILASDSKLDVNRIINATIRPVHDFLERQSGRIVTKREPNRERATQ